MEKWEMNLRDNLSALGFHDYKQWNETLYQWCTQWVNIINERDDLRAGCSTSGEFSRRTVDVEVKQYGGYIPFKASLIYECNHNGMFSLSFLSSVSFDFEKHNSQLLSSEKDDAYNWEIDSRTGSYIRDKDDVLEILNLRFMKYMEWKNFTNSIGHIID